MTDDARTPLIRIEPSGVDDAGEILTLQRAAFVAEALPYDSVRHPALLQSLDELVAELATWTAVKAVLGSRLVGTVRTVVQRDALHVRRLATVPDLQGRGIARALLRHVEVTAPSAVRRFVLNTGDLNDAALRLYQHIGYTRTHREVVDERLTLVHLEKVRRP